MTRLPLQQSLKQAIRWQQRSLRRFSLSTMPFQQVKPSANGGQHDHTLCANRKTETAILHAKLDTVPPTIVNSQGIYLITEDGRKIVDASTGAAVACIGHNNARVNSAIMSQLNSFAYIYSPFFTSKISEKLARALSDSTQNQMAKAFIVSSGSIFSRPPHNHVGADPGNRHRGDRSRPQDGATVFPRTSQAPDQTNPFHRP